MKNRKTVLTGTRFHKLTLKEHLFLGEKGRRRSAYRCECDCGNIKIILAQSIKSGRSKSCGCGISEQARTHGMSKQSEFWIWQGIIQRCENPNQTGYSRYGARGITVDARWKKFENFIEDMGRRPSPEHSVDRKDGTKGYSKENCRWATREEQFLNRSITVLVPFDGDMLTVNKLSQRTGINRNTLRARIRAGWTPEQIVEPARDRTYAELCKK